MLIHLLQKYEEPRTNAYVHQNWFRKSGNTKFTKHLLVHWFLNFIHYNWRNIICLHIVCRLKRTVMFLSPGSHIIKLFTTINTLRMFTVKYWFLVHWKMFLVCFLILKALLIYLKVIAFAFVIRLFTIVRYKQIIIYLRIHPIKTC